MHNQRDKPQTKHRLSAPKIWMEKFPDLKSMFDHLSCFIGLVIWRPFKILIELKHDEV